MLYAVTNEGKIEIYDLTNSLVVSSESGIY